MTEKIENRIAQIQRGEVPSGYIKIKDGVYPSDWTIKMMKQWISLKERPVVLLDDNDYELVTVRRAYGGVDSRGSYKGKNVLVKTYFSVKEDDFIISKRQIAHGACGLVPAKLHGAVVSNEYNVFVANEGTNIHFFNLMMQLPHYKRLFYLMSDGVHIEKLLFKTSDWMKRSLAMPSLAEQMKIAEILSTQDKLIALKEKLIEEKKRQKKYLMQQLLTGKMRLPGFFSRWDVCKLAEILSEGSKVGVEDTSHYRKMTVKLAFKGLELVKHDREMADTRPFYIRNKNEIIIGKQNYFNGSVALVTDEFAGCICSNAIMSFFCKNANVKYVLEYISQTDFMKKHEMLANGTGQKELSEKDFLNFKIRIPNIEEQNKIAKVLSIADNEINLLQKDLYQEKQKKKSLMQLLLSGIVRVNI